MAREITLNTEVRAVGNVDAKWWKAKAISVTLGLSRRRLAWKLADLRH